MVRDFEHATAIQRRRVAAGRRGLARAVVRYLLREHAQDYRQARAALPVWTPSPPKETPPRKGPAEVVPIGGARRMDLRQLSSHVRRALRSGAEQLDVTDPA